jgi:hypothetical protein
MLQFGDIGGKLILDAVERKSALPKPGARRPLAFTCSSAPCKAASNRGERKRK